jgi:hypothetical protein
MKLTPEQEQAHNEKMIAAVDGANPNFVPEDNAEDDSKDTSNDEPKDTPELPEGVTLEMLLEAYGKAPEPKEEDKTHEGDTDADEDTDEKSDKDSDKEEVNPLAERVKQLEDELVQNNIYAEAGGKEAYESLRTRAEGTLSEQQLNLMNTAITEGSNEQAVAAVQLMKTLFSQEQNAQPKKENAQELEGKTHSESNSFISEAEFHAAMSNPLYKSKTVAGTKHRAEVARKLSNSKF